MKHLKYRIFAYSLLASTLLGCTDTGNTSHTNSNETTTATTATSAPTTVNNANLVVTHAHTDWAGLWIGQEGLFVDISTTAPGQYSMQMLDDLARTVTVVGKDMENGIGFERDGKNFLLRRSSGDEIGLKYLDGETNCLMVQEGEGFCR